MFHFSAAIRDPDRPEVLIEGVLFRARYLGSTQLISEGQPSKAMRMMQAQEAVGRIKVCILNQCLLFMYPLLSSICVAVLFKYLFLIFACVVHFICEICLVKFIVCFPVRSFYMDVCQIKSNLSSIIHDQK